MPEIMTAPHSPTSPDGTTRKLDLNVTQVAATALAAVTAAVLGSELGAAGTIIGAAAASVVTTVGTAVYKASLERSRERVRSLAQRTRPARTVQEQLRTERFDPAPQSAPLGEERVTQRTRGPQVRERSRRFAALRGGVMVVVAVGGFLLAMMVITGFEWASGGTVGGHGTGTTIGRVVTDPAPRQPATPPASDRPAAPASETPSETTETTETSDAPTTAPNDDAELEDSPTETSDRPAPSERRPTPTPTPPLIPGLPGVGG